VIIVDMEKKSTTERDEDLPVAPTEMSLSDAVKRRIVGKVSTVRAKVGPRDIR
jgi:hypothetical protein